MSCTIIVQTYIFALSAWYRRPVDSEYMYVYLYMNLTRLVAMEVGDGRF